jgi:hypothetical protein
MEHPGRRQVGHHLHRQPAVRRDGRPLRERVTPWRHRLDPTQPEALVYAPNADGQPTLAALEYIVFDAAWIAAGHADTDPPQLFGRTFALTPAGFQGWKSPAELGCQTRHGATRTDRGRTGSPARSGAPRAAGSRSRTPTSPTSTRSTRAGTSRPGRSQSSSRRRCEPLSSRCVNCRHAPLSRRPSETGAFVLSAPRPRVR